MTRKQLLLTAALSFCCTSLFAIEQPDLAGPKQLVFKSPELEVSELNTSVSTLVSPAERTRAQRLGVAAERTHIDMRTGRFATLTPAVPLLPGTNSPRPHKPRAS